MPKSSFTHHLYKNNQIWTFRFRWPEDIRSSIDDHYEFHRSLNTHHLRVALERRNHLLAFCKRFVGAVRASDKIEVKKLRNELDFLVNFSDNEHLNTVGDLANFSVEMIGKKIDKNLIQLVEDGWINIIQNASNLDFPNTDLDHIKLLEQLKDTTIKSLKSQNVIPFDKFTQQWLESRKEKVTAKTLRDSKLAVVKFKKAFPTLGSVKRSYVKIWFEEQGKVYSFHRLKKFQQHLQSYWDFLKVGIENIYVEDDSEPFIGINIEKPAPKLDELNKWLPFPNLGKDTVLLLKGAYAQGDQQLVNLIILSMYTGMRIEETCSLSVENIFADYIFVPIGKATPGTRKIPVHSMLAEPLTLMLQNSEDNFIITGLSAKNQAGIRSDPIGKRFGRLKKSLGFGPQHVFDSIRKTVIAMLEQEDVPKDTINYMLGQQVAHQASGRSSMQERIDAIEKLVYPLDDL